MPSTRVQSSRFASGVSAAITGSILPFAGSSVPTNYVLCDGSAISRTTFSALFAIIGTTYGVGDGSTTFNVPDLRGKTLFGKAPSGTFTTIGATGGVETHSHTASSNHTHGFVGNHSHTVGTHSHTITTNSHTHAINSVTGNHINGTSSFQVTPRTHNHGGSSSTDPGGSTTANVLPSAVTQSTDTLSNNNPFAVINFIVRT